MLRQLSSSSWPGRCRRALAASVASLFLVFAMGSAGAAYGGSDPVIDGNGDDLIAFAANIGAAGCGLDVLDARDDVSISDDGIVPCAIKEFTNGGLSPDYYINGKDLRRFVSVYRTSDQALFLLWRAEGVIGDVDGNGNPDNNNCAGGTNANFIDQFGIGSEDSYEALIDANCDDETDITVSVRGEVVLVNGAPYVGATFQYRANAGTGASGKDLEVRLDGLVLNAGFKISAFSGAIRDGLGEDVTRISSCVVNPNISLVKTAEPASICPGGTTVFRMVITNTGDVDLNPVSLVDDLPAGLEYVEVVSNTCGGSVSAVAQRVTIGPFSLAAGASCTIEIRARAGATCLGPVVNFAEVTGDFQSPCVNNGEVVSVFADDTAEVICNAAPCVQVEATCDPAVACPGTPVTVSGKATNCGNGAETIYLTVAGETRRFDGVAPNDFVSFDVIVSMPSCSADEQVRFDVSAIAETGCGRTDPIGDFCTVECRKPQIEIEKSVSPEGPVDQGALLTYTITVTNPSKEGVSVERIVVTDDLCSESVYAGNASPTPTSEPNIGSGGSVVWNLASLAPGAAQIFTFQVRIVELPAPGCESTDRLCTNNVRVVGFCGTDRSEDSAEVSTPIIPCVAAGLCRLTGGGCLNEDGDNRGHKQSTFGGNSSPFHEGGGPTGNSWQHVYRDGREILFNWHSWDAYVTQCTVVGTGPCSPQAENTKADFQGTGKYSLGAGSREEAGNMVAYIIDHREGACNRNTRDEYSIIVRSGLVIGQGAIVFQTSGEIDCGNLQIHETPRWLFSGGTQQPGTLNEVESVALLNRAVPNPFRGNMSYAFEVVGDNQPVDVGVYNVAGRLVKSLVQTTLPAGRHTATWNGMDDSGARVPSGVYFVRARYGAEQKQQRVIYLGQ